MKSEGDKKLSVLIKEKASELGFDLCGIAKTKVLSDNGRILEKWCEAGMNAGMSYLQRNIERRINPGLLMPGAKSIVVTGLCYYSELRQRDPHAPVLSRYAYGLNYHDVITPMLEKLMEFIRTLVPDCEGRIFCDSGPLLEKAWARQAGLGWQGRHSIMINEKIGSFFFIGSLVLNIELDYDAPFENDYCGNCTECIDSCPTGAINDDHTIDARKCIANLTIENRGPIPEEIIPRLGGRVYGCDTCQKVCPWNNPPKCGAHPEFGINKEVATMTREDWQSLTEEQYSRLFKNTAVERVSYSDLMRNINAAIKSMDYQ
jgi:epoxyqueuosine reductase